MLSLRKLVAFMFLPIFKLSIVQYFILRPLFWLGFQILDRLYLWSLGKKPPSPFLAENFAPINSQLFQHNVEVISGHIPTNLNGLYVRNGPNNTTIPKGTYHWFDGDGMLHALRFKNGSANYTNHLLETGRLHVKRVFGPRALVSLGDLTAAAAAEGEGEGEVRITNMAVLLKLLLRSAAAHLGLTRPPLHNGSGNAAVVFHARRLLALSQPQGGGGGGALPLCVHVTPQGGLRSTGTVHDFGGQLGAPPPPLTARPRVDASTGEMMVCGGAQMPTAQPQLSYAVISRAGRVTARATIPLRRASAVRDCAVTSRHSILLDLPSLAVQRQQGGEAVHADARFGIMPRHGDESSVRWFSASPCSILHTANAWWEQEEEEEGKAGEEEEEEGKDGGADDSSASKRGGGDGDGGGDGGGDGDGGEQKEGEKGEGAEDAAAVGCMNSGVVVLIACRLPVPTALGAATAATAATGYYHQQQQQLWEYRFNLRLGTTEERPLLVPHAPAPTTPLPLPLPSSVDLPVVNPAFLGRRSRYLYVAELISAPAVVCATLKVDIATGRVVGRFDYGNDRFAGEVTFVPRGGSGGSGGDDSGSVSSGGDGSGSESGSGSDSDGSRCDPDGGTSGNGDSGGTSCGGVGSSDGSEDDGYLITFVYDTDSDTSQCVIIDARTMSSSGDTGGDSNAAAQQPQQQQQQQPVAMLLLPQRVPYGFHGTWVSQQQMRRQLSNRETPQRQVRRRQRQRYREQQGGQGGILRRGFSLAAAVVAAVPLLTTLAATLSTTATGIAAGLIMGLAAVGSRRQCGSASSGNSSDTGGSCCSASRGSDNCPAGDDD